MKFVALLLGLAFCLSCRVSLAADRFEQVFSWGIVRDEAAARAYKEIGVTDVRAAGSNGFLVARKYGMRTYCTFSPSGGRAQVMRPEEQAYFDKIHAVELKGKLSRVDYGKEVERRLKAAQCQFGGEPVTDLDVCHYAPPCFLSDAGGGCAKGRMEKILAENPLADGVVFDGIGYANLHSCECPGCRARLAAWLRDNGLTENADARNRFYREALVGYVNMMVDCARHVRPGIRVAIHLWPTFAPDPLYGKDLKADCIQETVAWYFPWTMEKIADYTRRLVAAAHRPGTALVPFVGLKSSKEGALAYKSPERLEAELQVILANGATRLAVCNGDDMLSPGYREVFRKYAPR